MEASAFGKKTQVSSHYGNAGSSHRAQKKSHPVVWDKQIFLLGK